MKLLLTLLLLVTNCYAQTIIRSDDMELPGTWKGVRLPGINSNYVGGTTSANDCPSNELQYYSADSSYRLLGTGLGSSAIEYDTLLFPNVINLNTTLSYRVRFRLASIAYNPASNLAAGVDLSDSLKLEYSPNNGLSWWREANIIGTSNACWGFTGPGQLVNKISTFPNFSTMTYTSTSSNPIREVTLTLPPGISRIRIRIISQVNAIGESFLIDDVQIIEPSILPISLISFTGSKKGTGVELKWSTASETNNDYFSIYKSPNGLEYWQLVANVQGTGNSSTVTNYTFTDPYPVNGLNYYVLMQTDYDGRREQFPPIVVMFTVSPLKNIWEYYNFLGQAIK